MDYPQSHGDITPGAGFVRMPLGRRLGGLPEGFHICVLLDVVGKP